MVPTTCITPYQRLGPKNQLLDWPHRLAWILTPGPTTAALALIHIPEALIMQLMETSFSMVAHITCNLGPSGGISIKYKWTQRRRQLQALPPTIWPTIRQVHTQWKDRPYTNTETTIIYSIQQDFAADTTLPCLLLDRNTKSKFVVQHQLQVVSYVYVPIPRTFCK